MQLEEGTIWRSARALVRTVERRRPWKNDKIIRD
jgi:hypothetical protein